MTPKKLLMIFGCDPIHRREIILIETEYPSSTLYDTISLDDIDYHTTSRKIKSI